MFRSILTIFEVYVICFSIHLYLTLCLQKVIVKNVINKLYSLLLHDYSSYINILLLKLYCYALAELKCIDFTVANSANSLLLEL